MLSSARDDPTDPGVRTERPAVWIRRAPRASRSADAARADGDRVEPSNAPLEALDPPRARGVARLRERAADRARHRDRAQLLAGRPLRAGVGGAARDREPGLRRAGAREPAGAAREDDRLARPDARTGRRRRLARLVCIPQAPRLEVGHLARARHRAVAPAPDPC